MFKSDILIIDEVLAVGDLAFQRKCFDRMEDMIKNRGNTVLIVSHNIRQITRMCKRILLFDHGRVISDGMAKEISELFYRRSNTKIADQASKIKITGQNLLKSGEVELESIKLLNNENISVNELVTGEPATIRCDFYFS